MRVPLSISTAAHASCPSRRASSRGSTLLRVEVVLNGPHGGGLQSRGGRGVGEGWALKYIGLGDTVAGGCRYIRYEAAFVRISPAISY